MGKFKIKNDFLPSYEATNGIHTLNSNRTNYITSWYTVANENIKTVAILLQNERISHAVFFLQQTVECLIKGLFLENRIALPSDIEEIKHYPNKAFRSYYEKVQDCYGVTFCDLFLNVVNKGKDFYEKLNISAQIANVLTTDYNNNINCDGKVIATKYDPIALGLVNTATQQECHKRAYKLYYFQYLLNILSYVFNHDVESNARYPQFIDDKSSIVPSSLFDSKIKTNLSLITMILDHIVKDVIETPFNMVYWSQGINTNTPNL